jgi:hypothetical protein
MKRKQLQEGFLEVQAAIYRVALSLDALLLNGIPFGVIRQAVFSGFVEKTASNLLREIGNLENQITQAPTPGPGRVPEVLAALRAKSQQLIAVVTGLRSFPTLPLQQLRCTVSQIPLLRGECVRLIQELEACFHVPKPFYQSRPSHSTASVDDFLANLERAFMEAWAASNAGR